MADNLLEIRGDRSKREISTGISSLDMTVLFKGRVHVSFVQWRKTVDGGTQ